MARPRIHVTASVPAEVEEALARDFELSPSPEGTEGIVSMLTTRVDGAYLDRAGPQLRVVANYAVGVNNVDLTAAVERNVVVANTPDVLTRATAELAVGLMLALLRRIVEGDRFVRRRDERTTPHVRPTPRAGKATPMSIPRVMKPAPRPKTPTAKASARALGVPR